MTKNNHGKTQQDYEVPPPQPVYAYPPAPPLAPVGPYQQTNAQLLQDRNATVAKVSVAQHSSYGFGALPDFEFTATGSSKREKGDKFNARTGELLALSRAYLKLSRDLYAAGRALVEPEDMTQEEVWASHEAAFAEAAEGDPAKLTAQELLAFAQEDFTVAFEHLEIATNWLQKLAESE